MLSALLLRDEPGSATLTPAQGPDPRPREPASGLRRPRPSHRRRGWEWAVVAAYAAGIAAVIPRHEPWFDEAQAWLIARDSTLPELLTTRMRYEGTPPLWHLILLPAVRLHLPYATLNVIAALISLVGVWLVVRRAPFPPVVRALLPFSFFIFYQYGVVARSYCLLAPLLFALAIVYPRKLEQPWRWWGLLALLANVSVHGFLIAGALQVLHLIEVRRAWATLDRSVRRGQVVSSAALALVAGIILFEIRPPADLTAGSTTNFSPLQFFRTAPANLTHALGISVVSVVVLVVTIWWLRRTRTLLLFVVPTTAVLLLFSVKYFNVWHEGTLFLLWVFVLWVSFERSPVRPPSPRPRQVITAAVLLSLLVQVSWTVNSVRYDWGHNYSGSREMAAYISAHGLEHRRIAALNYGSVALLPYFDHDIFVDLNDGRGPSYYLWSKRLLTLPNDPAVAVAMQPDYIVIAVKSYGQVLPCLGGYSRVLTVPGDLYWKTRLLEPERYILYAHAPDGAANCVPGPGSAPSRFG